MTPGSSATSPSSPSTGTAPATTRARPRAWTQAGRPAGSARGAAGGRRGGAPAGRIALPGRRLSVPELGLEDLAGGPLGELGAEPDFARVLVGSEALPAVRDDLLLVQADACVQHDDGDDLLAEPVVWLADDGRLADAGVGEQDLLDLSRIQVVTAADDQVLGAVDDEVEAVLVPVADVARVQPAAGQRARRRLRPVPVALHDVVAPDLDLPEL